jgi:hypothetical protein
VYGTLKGSDPTKFVGRRRELISLTVNTVHFALEGVYSLTPECALEHDRSQGVGGADPIRYEVPVAE